ncbi:PKD domain-containing protein [Sphingobacteriales bacterium UPWRP_1]|nr:hypothetical protein BVG80_10835 [Sphingobacteriales bacterium TSM_CSM]PSJ77415.1 PKD domain-containing protein [Sphingobacteriales bacterium UPWRP_1]
MRNFSLLLVALVAMLMQPRTVAQNVVTLPQDGFGPVQTASLGILKDNGGDDNYFNGTYSGITISPEVISCPLTLTFTEFDLNLDFDYLYLYDGTDNSSPMVGSYTGTDLPNNGLPIVSESGSFTIEMYSNIIIFPPSPGTNQGFTAIWQAGDSSTDAAFTASGNDVPANIPVQFTPANTGYDSYFWNFGDGNSSTEVNPSHTFSAQGAYTVSLTITNCEGTSATQSLEISVQEPPSITITPDNFDVTLAQGDSTTYSFTITNNGSGDLVFNIEGANLISEKELQVVSLINGADLDQEYAFTLDAIYNYYSDFQLTELTTYDAPVLQNALETADILLIPEQESCNAAAFSAFAPVLQAFAQNGGTIVINGTNQSNCIFNTGLFSGTYQNFYSGPLDIELPDDPLMEGVANPYDALAVTYYFDITNPDAVRLVQHTGYDVVCYRNIGLGRAILIGHDYRYHNADMDRIIANCISTTKDLISANGGFDWLFISDNSGTLAPGESITIDVEFNATDVYGGLFTQNLVINSNDAATPQFTIPCSLLVTGTPDFAISESNYNFGEVLENDTAKHNITIFNPGTDSLRVYNITFSDPAFTASPATFAVYGGGTEQVVELRFVPTEIAPYTATATIETNLINFFITVSGTGVGAPVTTVTPAAINVTLDAGTSTTVPLTIDNAGQGPLFYNIDTTYFQQQLKVLAYTNGADAFAYPNTLAAINTYFADYQLTETQTTDPDELADLLNEVNVLLVPAITDFNVFNLFDSFQLVLQDFVNSGGSVIYLGNFGWGDNPVLHSGFFDGYSSWNSGNVCNVLDETHPITQEVPNPYTPNGITPMIFFDTDLVRLVQQNGFDVSPGDVVCYKNWGGGKVIYIGHDFGGGLTDDSGAHLLSNALKWIGSQTILEWFNISSVEGTIGYPDSETLTVTLDATELVGGTYTTQIVISNNDPLAETITIPVTLTVVGIPAIEVSTTSLNFGNVIIGNTETLEIEIDNPGTDSLFLNIVSGLPEFVVAPESATIEPYGSITLQITFVPDEIELLNGQIFLNNNANNIVVNVTGYGQGAPIVGVNPPSLEVTLLAGETTTQTLTVTNTGAGPLEFTSNGSANIPILAWTYQLNTLNYSGLADALSQTGLSYSFEETDTDNPDEMAALLQGKRILLVPDQNFSSSPVFPAIGAVMQDFVEGGGTVLFLANQCDFCITQTGLFEGYIWAYLFNNVVAVLNDEHPLSTGLGSSYVSSANSIAFYFTNPDVVSLTDVFTGGSTLSYRQVGNGKVIYVGDNYTDYTDAEITMLKNALQWGGAPPQWIDFTPTDGTVEVGESFTVTVNFDANDLLAGTYTFDFTIISNDPATPILTVPCTMNVLAFPQAIVAAQPTYSCDGIVYFYDQSLNNPTSWSWDFGDGNTAGIQNPIHSYAQSGTYTVTLEACNDLGCDESVYTNLITVDFASVYCDTTDMPFSGIQPVTNCHGVLRDSGGDQNYLGGSNGIVTIEPTGATQIILNFSEFNFINNFEFSDQLLIYDGPDVNSPILGIYTGTDLPNGGTVTSTGGAITIQEFTYGWLGTASGFVATWDCVIIDSPPVPSFSYEVTDACLGTVEFTDESGNYPAEWHWDFTDGGTSDEQDPIHSFQQSGTFGVTLTSCNIAGCNSVTLPVTLSGVLFVNFTVPQYIQINSPVMFNDNTANATYWQWSFGNGQTAVGNVQNPVTFYNALGVYTVTLTVTDSNGCVRTASQTVTVVQDIGIGNNNQPLQTLQLYPNPATGAVNLQAQLPYGNQTAGITLYDATGRQVLNQQIQASGLFTHQLSLQNLSKGLYWVALQTQQGLMTQKLVVQ